MDAETPAKGVFRGDLGDGRDLVVFREPPDGVRWYEQRGVAAWPTSSCTPTRPTRSCDGASLPAELATRAAEYGYEALALTDHDNVCGAMELAQACRGLGLRPIHGAELTVSDGPRCGSGRLAVPPDGPGRVRGGLAQPLPAAERGARRDRGPTRSRPLPPVLALDSLLERSEGLVCLSGCARDGALAGPWERGEPRAAEAVARRLAASFGRERFRVELQRPLWRRDRARNRWLAGVAERLGVACVATGNVHAHDRARAELQDALVAVRNHTTLEESEPARRGNASSVLAPPAAIAARFAEHPEAVAETARLAERLRFDLTSELGYRYPGAEDPDADRTLAEICRGRLELRYAGERERPEAGAAAGGGAAGDPQARPLGLLPPCTSICSSSLARSRPRSAAPTRRATCCRPDAGAARASARSSAT